MGRKLLISFFFISFHSTFLTMHFLARLCDQTNRALGFFRFPASFRSASSIAIFPRLQLVRLVNQPGPCPRHRVDLFNHRVGLSVTAVLSICCLPDFNLNLPKTLPVFHVQNGFSRPQCPRGTSPPPP